MDNTNAKVPELRFPEFKESWESKKLGDHAKFSKGKGISKKDIIPNGSNYCIRYGELYTEYNEIINIDKIVSKTNVLKEKSILSKKNDVIIPSSGETQIDIATASCVLDSDIILGGDLNIIRSRFDGVFLAYYLNNKKKLDIARLAQGNSVVHLYNKNLSSLNLNIPCIKEQQKIASFLSQVDKKIDLLTQKGEQLELYKKGVMQKLFSQEIRFKQDNGEAFPEWEEKRLGNVCKLQGGYAFKSNLFKKEGIPVIRISNISNDNNHIDLTNLVHYNKIDLSENFILKKNDLIVAMSGATTGKSSVYNLEQIGYLNQRVGVFRPKKKLNNKFLIQFVFSNNFSRQIKKVLVAGAQPNISSKDIESFKIQLPSLEEQTKIVNVLSAIDQKIDYTQQQLEQTKMFKKGLLQKMFV
ncbi:MAG: restriction endonuclease subunit S [Bacteroidetes bacterium]|jgi:type I restriction enzyme S subunit|nr:restriction endonuclease subunit S [Bacteroidota bacterium]